MSVEDKIREIIADSLSQDPEETTDDSYLSDDFGMDPYDLEDLAGVLMEEFSVEISEDDIESWETVSDVIAMVMEKLEKDGQGD